MPHQGIQQHSLVRSYLLIVAVLQILAVDPGQRGVSEGVALMSGAPFLLQHCATKQVCSALRLLQACLSNFYPVLSEYPIGKNLVELRKVPLDVCIQCWHDENIDLLKTE